ncbi:hypothetical protein FT643_00840 [Ketobacter sp. MCCC 1A13808]|uniref:hypothetical protein n=1 Tax=Ketobacter sp. MCCC 1A13808 TaxID=2602738 RepID=UPI000F1E12A0|nr:hypothetical protein [Ketobacter sp. MCCC 1A13808]MVF10675.1 hypothetical protein [Ketobacter sp. MCCC 1A13808]RLP56095.1 MAG: hypothetical protein D6160_01465 [Ketobacter sp.]
MALFKPFIEFVLERLTKVQDSGEHGLSDFERVRNEIKPCDVLLIEGTSRSDRVIQKATQSSWSHAVLYIGRLLDIPDPDLKTIISHFFEGDADTPLIIESRLGEGIVVKPLHYYEHEHVRICRPKSLNRKDTAQVIRFAINRLGAHRGGGYMLDLIRFYLPWSLLPLNWRTKVLGQWAGRHTKNVSAAFIAECFGFIQFPVYPLVKINGDQGIRLLRRHPKLCMPNEIDQSPNFEIIKYPFIDFKIYENERLIPWKGSGIYSGVDQEPALTFDSKPTHLNHVDPKQLGDQTKITPINTKSD